MNRWAGKIAVVTGASAGIGAATAIDLIKAGMIVVGLARRSEKILELRKKLNPDVAINLHAYKCDVGKEEDVINAFAWIEEKFGGVDVLINNAGCVGTFSLLDKENTDMIKSIVDTNIMGVVWCTREAFRSMKNRHVDGHIVLINSILGHYLGTLAHQPQVNIYPATKHAITALTETYRQEFMAIGSKTKISSISPGLVETEIISPEKFEFLKNSGYPILQSEDISQAILYVLGTPPHVQVHELIIKPVGEKVL